MAAMVASAAVSVLKILGPNFIPTNSSPLAYSISSSVSPPSGPMRREIFESSELEVFEMLIC